MFFKTNNRDDEQSKREDAYTDEFEKNEKLRNENYEIILKELPEFIKRLSELDDVGIIESHRILYNLEVVPKLKQPSFFYWESFRSLQPHYNDLDISKYEHLTDKSKAILYFYKNTLLQLKSEKE